jgi:DNA-binding response OmpR family regulator
MPAAQPSAQPRRRVLVVDDDAHSRGAVARLLEDEGYAATVASDGEEASGLLLALRPDLVLTDLTMPRLDGLGLLREVRRRLPGTPVIVLSARGTPQMAAAAEGFFAKPVHVDELLARIHSLIGP